MTRLFPLLVFLLMIPLGQLVAQSDSVIDETDADSADSIEPVDGSRIESSFTYWPAATERPRRSIGTSIVPKTERIYELSLGRTRNDDNGVKTTTDVGFQALIRTGIRENFEFQFGFAGLIAEDTEVAGIKRTSSGFGDISIGAKLRLVEQSDRGPSVAVLTRLSLPTGAKGSGSPDPSFVVAASQQFLVGPEDSQKPIEVFGNLGVSWLTDRYSADNDRDTLSQLDYAIGVGFGPNRLNVELFGDWGLSRDGGPRHSIAFSSSGVAESEIGNLQSDLSVAFGLSEDAPDWSVSVGFSFWRKPAPKTATMEELETMSRE